MGIFLGPLRPPAGSVAAVPAVGEVSVSLPTASYRRSLPGHRSFLSHSHRQRTYASWFRVTRIKHWTFGSFRSFAPLRSIYHLGDTFPHTFNVHAPRKQVCRDSTLPPYLRGNIVIAIRIQDRTRFCPSCICQPFDTENFACSSDYWLRGDTCGTIGKPATP